MFAFNNDISRRCNTCNDRSILCSKSIDLIFPDLRRDDIIDITSRSRRLLPRKERFSRSILSSIESIKGAHRFAYLFTFSTDLPINNLFEIMYALFTVLVAYAGLALISAAIPPNVIEADLAEVTRLSQDFQRSSPAVLRQFNDASCQMITQCCPHLRQTFASMSLSGKTDAVMEQCFGRKDSSTFLSKIMSCPPFTTLTSLSKNSQFSKYAEVLSKKAAQGAEDMQMTVSVCSPDEIYAMTCEWNRADLQASCQRKVLQTLAQRGDQVYRNKVEQTKSGYAQITNELRNIL